MMRSHAPWRVVGVVLLTAAASIGRAGPQKALPLAEEGRLLKAAGVQTDLTGLLAFFRKRTLGRPDQERVAALVRRLGDDSFQVREKASADLVTLGTSALPFLRRALQDPDLEIRRRAGECLKQIRRGPNLAIAGARLLQAHPSAETCAALLDYLPFAEDDLAEEEVLATLSAMGVPTSRRYPVLTQALADPDPRRRAAAALVLAPWGLAEHRVALRRLLTDADAGVRMRTAQGFIAAGDKSAIPTLVALLTEGTQDAARHAETVLEWLAAEQAPHARLGTDPSARRQCRTAWEGWWDLHKDKLMLARPDMETVLCLPSLHANLLARKFLRALMAQDMATVQRISDVPFLFKGATLSQPVELIRAFRRIQFLLVRQQRLAVLENNNGREGPAGHGPRDSFTIEGVVHASDYLEQAPADERNALTQERCGTLRVVRVHNQIAGLDDIQAVFVRIDGDKIRVVGLGAGRQAEPHEP
jgi:hypothetical protein